MAHPGKSDKAESDFATEREILYKILFDMRNDLNDLKDLTRKVMQSGVSKDFEQENASLITKVYEDRPVTRTRKAHPENGLRERA